MRQVLRLAAIVLLPGCSFLAALVSYAAFDAYVLNNCDAKFGCAGGVQIAAYLAFLALLSSSAAHIPACLIFRKAILRTRPWLLTTAILALGFAQGALWLGNMHLPGNTMLGLMASWACASFLLAIVVLSAISRWPPNNSFKPNPLRGPA